MSAVLKSDAQPAPAGPLAIELRDVRKSFGKSEIIRGATLAIPSANGTR